VYNGINDSKNGVKFLAAAVFSTLLRQQLELGTRVRQPIYEAGQLAP